MNLRILLRHHKHSFHTPATMKEPVTVKCIITWFEGLDGNGCGLIRHKIYVYQDILLAVY